MATTQAYSAASTLRLDSGVSSSTLTFEAFDLVQSNQRVLGPPHENGSVIPLALKPSASENAEVTLDAAIETIKGLQARGDVLTKLLAQHGTLLFRGLPGKHV